jgi:Helix-turn-helix domain
MEWLNAVSLDCEIGATTFRVAYLVADRLNRVAGYAWPALDWFAKRLCLSDKSVQRSVRQLERAGWLQVTRQTKRSNHYRISWPDGREPRAKVDKQTSEAARDEFVPEIGQLRSPTGDKNVRQSYLTNLTKTYLRRPGGGSNGKGIVDQGKYELAIVNRFGGETANLLQQLHEIAPAALGELCQMERDGFLTRAEIDAARLTVLQQQNMRKFQSGL